MRVAGRRRLALWQASWFGYLKNDMKRKILLLLLVLVLGGVLIGFKMYRQETPDVVDQKPDVVTDTRSLIAAFDQDTASAARKYIDKVVGVCRPVKSIDTPGTITLGDSTSASAVTCGLDRRHMKDYEQLKPGAPAVIQGVCAG